VIFIFIFKDFICLKERARAQAGGAEAEGEVDSLLSREPVAGAQSQELDHDLNRRQTLN